MAPQGHNLTPTTSYLPHSYF